jgi:phage terminase large subunit GpA-like protein
VVKVKYTNGFKKRFYELPQGKRNEALDLRVYAFAGLLALNVRWGDLAAADAAKPPPKMEIIESSEPVPPSVEDAEEPTIRKRIREGSRGGGWLNNGKTRRGGWI